MLPGMKLGWDLRTGFDRYLSSWKSLDDPSPGDFTWGVQPEGNPEIVSWKGSNKYYRSGPWNGIGFSGAPEIVGLVAINVQQPLTIAAAAAGVAPTMCTHPRCQRLAATIVE
jgi:hypothetical protein